MTEAKQGILERLDKWSAVWWQARGEIKGGNPKEEYPEILIKEAATAIRELRAALGATDYNMMACAETFSPHSATFDLCKKRRLENMTLLTKYQETK